MADQVFLAVKRESCFVINTHVSRFTFYAPSQGIHLE